jgi:CRISPR/Cas system CSM-associated protein Csm3 (group 7 of RAMP superfamily)
MKPETMTHRYVARFELEAVTPVFIGSGESGLLVDALIRSDCNGLPVIPGTAMAGVLRHSLESDPGKVEWKSFFGYQDGDEGTGSRLMFSDGLFILNDGKVIEGAAHELPSDVVALFRNLPVRRHVRIDEKGVADKTGLFDNQVLPAGARFRCEFLLKGDVSDGDAWGTLIAELGSPRFRLGQGTRKGYGRLKVIGLKERVFDLRDSEHYREYLAMDPSLNSEFKGHRPEPANPSGERTVCYELRLKPDLFFIFGSGKGERSAGKTADHKPVTEWTFVYGDDGRLRRSAPKTLIPASSLKGAIAHRVCYHHNRIRKMYVDRGGALKKNEDPAVAYLFGRESSAEQDGGMGEAGRVFIDDILIDDSVNDSVFHHVAIDRFTGGVKRGFLFSEQVTNLRRSSDGLTVRIHIDRARNPKGIPHDDWERYRQALEDSLKDVCRGLLPLGGMAAKGHGMFTGELYRDSEKIYSYEDDHA